MWTADYRVHTIDSCEQLSCVKSLILVVHYICKLSKTRMKSRSWQEIENRSKIVCSLNAVVHISQFFTTGHTYYQISQTPLFYKGNLWTMNWHYVVSKISHSLKLNWKQLSYNKLAYLTLLSWKLKIVLSVVHFEKKVLKSINVTWYFGFCTSLSLGQLILQKIRYLWWNVLNNNSHRKYGT